MFEWLSIASFGDWHPGVPPGKVLVIATENGDDAQAARRRSFHVDAKEYDSGPRPFPIDTKKHKEVQ